MRVLVYTANFGGKDEAPRLLNKNKLSTTIQFVCLTDNKQLTSTDYEVRLVTPPYADAVKSSRFFKINGIPNMQAYDLAIWHDSSIVLDCAALHQLLTFSNHGLSTFKHKQICLYAEARKAIELRKDNPLRIALQMMYYGFVLKFPTGAQIYETGIMVQNVHAYTGSSLQKTWWRHVRTMSCRDQLSLPIASWKSNTKLGTLEGRGHHNPYSEFIGHNKNRYRPANFLLRFNTALLRKVGTWIIFRVELYMNNRARN